MIYFRFDKTDMKQVFSFTRCTMKEMAVKVICIHNAQHLLAENKIESVQISVLYLNRNGNVQNSVLYLVNRKSKWKCAKFLYCTS